MITLGRSRLLPTAIVVIMGVWLFAQAIFADGLFAFRDAADFYYPLFQLVQREWQAGRVPLWNPYDNLGIPLAANPTSSVWYPAKLLFCLPISFEWAYRIYVIGHVFLAAAAAYRLARHWRAGPEAATLAAISHAFCGPVLYQYANIVFLVGAAWLPLALAAADVMLRQSSVRHAMLFGLTLAMMILGGEPQTAYHTLFLAALYWLLVVRVEHPPADRVGLGLWRTWIGAMGLFTVAGATLFLLAAVQILPSKEFADRSDRAVRYNARTIWEIPTVLGQDDAGKRIRDGLLADMSDDGHLEQVYRFSVEPHRLAELIWPNCGGRQFPVHRRWFDELSEENYIWTPSLYLGLLPLLLAWSQFRLFRGKGDRHLFQAETARRTSQSPATQRWLSWMFLLAATASLGTFGIGWIVRHFGVDCSEPVGGVYWLLTVLLPGYIQFRYPAKWMTVAALAVAMLAARGWQAIQDDAPDAGLVRLRRSCWTLAAISTLGFIVALIVRTWWSDWIADAEPNMMFGPLDVYGAHNDLLWSLGQTALLSLAIRWLVSRTTTHFAHPKPTRCTGWDSSGAAVGSSTSEPCATAGLSSSVSVVRWTGWLACVLLAIDLAVANGWTVVCVPAQLWREPSKLADYIRAETSKDNDNDAGVPVRIHRQWIWLPEAWKEIHSRDRLAVAVRWHCDALAPQHHQSFGVASVRTYGTLILADFENVLDASPAGALCNDLDVFANRFLILLTGVRYRVTPSYVRSWGTAPDGGKHGNLAKPIGPLAADIRITEQKNRMPRAWIVHEEVKTHPSQSLYSQRRSDLLPEVFSSLILNGVGWRPMQKALVEGRELPKSTAPTSPEPCRITHYDPQCVRIEAELQTPGLVILSDQFYPGWELQVASDGRPPRPVEILRTNLVMRGAWLPAGKHVLEYRYRPGSFLAGAAISGVAWGLGLVGLGAWTWRRRTRRPA